jgi:DNA-binding transcriptional MocR family regulator
MPEKLLKTKEAETEFVKDYERLLSVKELAKEWGCARQTASTTLKKLGVEIQRPRREAANSGNWKGDYHPKLGEWSDQMVANDIKRKTGKTITRAAVQVARVRRGIKSQRERMLEAYKEALP